MKALYQEWLDGMVGDLRKNVSAHCASDVKAALIESLREAHIGPLSIEQSYVLQRIDHLLRTLGKYAQQEGSAS